MSASHSIMSAPCHSRMAKRYWIARDRCTAGFVTPWTRARKSGGRRSRFFPAERQSDRRRRNRAYPIVARNLANAARDRLFQEKLPLVAHAIWKKSAACGAQASRDRRREKGGLRRAARVCRLMRLGSFERIRSNPPKCYGKHISGGPSRSRKQMRIGPIWTASMIRPFKAIMNGVDRSGS